MAIQPIIIALLGDIHGNLPALEAVLTDARQWNVRQIWNLGDFVGYGPFPNEVVWTVRKINAVSIIGNYDRKVLSFPDKKDKWEKTKMADKYAAFGWNYENLTDAGKAYLNGLPEQERLEVEGFRVLLTHGSPASNKEGIDGATTKERLVELAKVADADVVACGHTHRPFLEKVSKTWFVNPGSVGRPEGGDWRASYALLHFTRRELRVRHRHVEYNLKKATRAIQAAGLPDDFIRVLQKGKNLTGVLENTESRSGAGGCRVDDNLRLKAIVTLAERCDYEREHTHQVTRLSLLLFDGLTALHRMGGEERFWLQCGALLHDIGWLEGQQGHHKTAIRIIMADSALPFTARERRIVGLIARYHRKALPRPDHQYFQDLDEADRQRVEVLAGILRVADALDRSHTSCVTDVECDVGEKDIVLVITATGSAEAELLAVDKKSDLLSRVFHKDIVARVAVKVRGRTSRSLTAF
jgi:putative phosphoesterase